MKEGIEVKESIGGIRAAFGRRLLGKGEDLMEEEGRGSEEANRWGGQSVNLESYEDY